MACPGVAWLLVAASSFYSIPPAGNWLLGLAGWLAGWVLAVVVSLGVTVMAWRSGRRLLAVLTVTLGVVAATTILSVDWPSVYVHRFFRDNRAAFADALARYQGVTSPAANGVLMEECVAWIFPRTVPGGPPAVFLPQVLGVPDGGAGYAHLDAGQVRETFDCFADPCRAGLFLGDGWYWVA